MFNVKQSKMNEFVKYIWQLIIGTLNAALEVPSLRPVYRKYLYFTTAICKVFHTFCWDAVWDACFFCGKFLTDLKMSLGVGCNENI